VTLSIHDHQASTNNAHTATVTACAVAAKDLITVQIGNSHAGVPTFVLHNSDPTVGHTLITEDETIAVSSNGATVYGDGTGSVAYDRTEPDTVGGAYVYSWTIRVDPASTATSVNVTVTWPDSATGSGRRITIVTATPSAASTVPSRADRIGIANCLAGGTHGWGTNDTNVPMALVGTVPTGDLLVIIVVKNANTPPTATADIDGTPGGSDAGADLNGSSANHVFAKVYAGTDSGRPSTVNSVLLNCSGQWGAGTAAQVLVYPMGASGGLAQEHDSPHGGTVNSGGTATGLQAVENDTAHAGTASTGPSTYITAQGEVSLPAPTAGTHHRLSFLSVDVSKAVPENVGDFRFELRQGATTIDASGWVALTDVPATLLIFVTQSLGTITDETDLRFYWETRHLNTETLNSPVISRVVLLPEYWAVESETAGAGSVNVTPVSTTVNGAQAVEHDTRNAGTVTGASTIFTGTQAVEFDGAIPGQVPTFIPTVSTVLVTTADLLDLRVPVRADRFVFELLDAAHNLIGQLDVGEDQPPVISVDTSRAAVRSVSNFEVYDSDLVQIDTVHERVRPVMILQNGDRFPLGICMFGQDNRDPIGVGTALGGQAAPQSRHRLTPELFDETFIVDRQLDTTYSAATGDSIVGLIRQLLAPIPLAGSVVIEAADQPARSPLVYRVGTGRVAALTALAGLLGCYPPFFDNAGDYRFKVAPTPGAADVDLIYELNGRIISGSVLTSSTVYRAPNRYIVIGDDPTVPTVGVYDLPPGAPHSAAALGYVTTTSRNMQGLANQAIADQAAYVDALTDRTPYGSVVFDGTADPRHDTYNLLQVLGVRYLETAWRLACVSGGVMSHSATTLW
jgi:hypothetical protein